MSMIARGTRLCTTIALVLLAAGCAGDPVPSAALAIGATSLQATVAASPATIPTVRITDAKGRGVRNVLVRWQVTAGGGTVTNDTVRTAKDGTASSGGWRLGTVAGLQTISASADGVPPVTFTALAAPGPVAQLVPASRDAPNPVVNTVLTPTPAVRALDSYGNPVPGVPVTFAVLQGTGAVTGEQQSTNDQGLATLGAWKLGIGAGVQVLRASAPGANPTTFTVVAVAGPAVDLIRVTASAIDGPTGMPVTPAPGVKVVDQFGNGVGNVPVTFTAGANSGVVSSATVLSDPANGTAFVGAWVLGTGAQQTLTATSSMLPARSVTFNATLVATNFGLEVRFVGTPTTLVQTAFTDAARRWRSIIVGHVHDTFDASFDLQTNCDRWLPRTLNETIKDVIIFARTAPIDGAGEILGQAYVCAYNPNNNMPVIGVMEFDEADMPALIAKGTLGDVILHEMGHVLGFGTLWTTGRSLLAGGGSSDPYFVGATARTEFRDLNTITYSGTPVPIENGGGAGTRDSHWRESILTDELMTGYLSGASRPLSRLTVGAMKDMGYVVSFGTADPFRITASLYRFPMGEPTGLDLRDDVKRRGALPFGR